MFTRNRMSTPVVLAIGVVAAFVALWVAAVWLGSGSSPSGEQNDALFSLVYVPFVVMGALVVARHPRNPVGWLLAGVGLSANLGFFIQEYAIQATVTAPGSLPLGPLFAWVSYWIWMTSLGALLFMVVLFPTGRVASPRWRPMLWASGLMLGFVTIVFAFGPDEVAFNESGLVNPLAIEAMRPLGIWVDESFWVFLLLFALAVASVIARFRASRGVERQQLKWAAGGCALAAITLALAEFGPDGIGEVGWIIALAAIPVSFAIAMLRYRLYDIDVLINRGLVYGTLSALLLATYVVSVLALTALLRPITGSGDLAVVASTLAVLALFQPLRSRIQQFVDRRFYRARYDAARTIDRFGARLREQVDLDQLRGELIEVVDDTIKPAHASLWLRGGRAS